jgi:hypothetical protein
MSIDAKEPRAGETMTLEKIFWDEWFYVASLPDDLKRKLSAHDLRPLGDHAIRAMKKASII